MYEPVAKLISGEMRIQEENGILQVIKDMGIVVDKEELLKALEYDRNQYEKGYNDCLRKYSWISADTLPLDDNDVLVWFEYFRYGSYNRMFQTMGIGHTYNGEWSGFVNGQSGWHKLRIIAWQPLPEPPKMKGGDPDA